MGISSETESNDTIATADVLTSSLTAQIASRSDKDYFAITANSAGTLSVTIDSDANSSYTDYYTASIVNSLGQVLSSKEFGDEETLTASVVSAGDYYLVVEDTAYYHSTEQYEVLYNFIA